MKQTVNTIIEVVTLIVFALSAVVALGGFGYYFGAGQREQRMVDRCKETGMYLTEGYALSCKVLENKQ